MRKLFLALTVLGVVAGVVLLAGPGVVERRFNKVRPSVTWIADRAETLHRRIFVADLHADTLLWDRSLLDENSRGHVDVPRLIRGNVALQAFTVVTSAPAGINMTRNSDSSDMILPLAIVQRWPVESWSSRLARAMYQARKFGTAVPKSNRRLVWIKNATDLSGYVEHRKQGEPVTAGFLGIEGAQALDGDLGHLQELYDAGFRMMSPTHFTDNSFAGLATGISKGGLTAEGRALVRAMEERRMIVDLAHTSLKTIDDVLGIATRPVLVSHTGVRATCGSDRNLSDAQLKRIAAAGGVIGIAYFKAAVCGTDARAIARAIRHASDVAGVDHIALGSDFDGAVGMPFDVTELVAITDALLAAGFTEEEITKIMGGNVLRFLLANLPVG